MKQLITLGALGILLMACEGETPKPAVTQAAPPVPVQAPAPPAPAAIAEADIAVPDDFVDEAETEITSTNYKAELDALEKEVDTE